MEKDDLLLLKRSVKRGSEGDLLLLKRGGKGHPLKGAECSKKEEEEVKQKEEGEEDEEEGE